MASSRPLLNSPCWTIKSRKQSRRRRAPPMPHTLTASTPACAPSFDSAAHSHLHPCIHTCARGVNLSHPTVSTPPFTLPLHHHPQRTHTPFRSACTPHPHLHARPRSQLASLALLTECALGNSSATCAALSVLPRACQVSAGVVVVVVVVAAWY